MAKVTCLYCKKKIEKEDAYVVSGKKKNKYYCSKEHSKLKSPRDMMYEMIFDIFDKRVTNTILFKEFDGIASVHGYEKTYAYLEENKRYLETLFRNKQFNSEYGKIRYISAILKNNLADFKMKNEPIAIDKEPSEEIEQNNFKRKKGRKSIDSFLDDM